MQRHAVAAELVGELHDQDRVLPPRGPTTAIIPTWKYTSLGWPRMKIPSRAPRTPNGTPRSTAKGTDQLSYCAASTRNTMIRPSTNTSAASPLETRSWYDCPEYDTPIPDEANCP